MDFSSSLSSTLPIRRPSRSVDKVLTWLILPYPSLGNRNPLNLKRQGETGLLRLACDRDGYDRS